MPASVDKLLNSQYVQLALAALAFLIALWFVVVIARMLMGGRLRLPGGRTRQARLGIVDAFDLDRQRQLIIVRRDNTEHLIMIGGPNDVLIESEIVRVEARDVRDNRREKGLDGSGEPRLTDPRLLDPRLTDPRLGEPRIASRVGLDGPAGTNGATPPPVRSEEPFMPLALPQMPAGPTILPIAPVAPAPAPSAVAAPIDPLGAEGDPTEVVPRTPTFPLPPRRPTAPAPPPERRTQPMPLPERISRGNEPLPDSAPPLVPAQAPAPPSSEAPPQSPTAPVAPPRAILPPKPSPVLAPADRPVPARPTSFLKPLPPRPPIRPLRRTTPQAETGQPSAPPPDSGDLPAPPVAPSKSEPPQAASPRSAAQSLAEPALVNGSDEKNGLESLEEEMAKLLGR